MVASQRTQKQAITATAPVEPAAPTTPVSPPIEHAETATLVGKRGPSRGIATAKTLKASKMGKLSVNVSLMKCTPIGINDEIFASEVGVITSKNSPLDVEKWRLVDDQIKDKICDIVLRNAFTEEEPDMQEMWKITHMKSNESWVNEKVKQIDDDVTLLINDSLELENPPTPMKLLLKWGEKACMSYGIKPKISKLRIQAQLEEVMQDRDELAKEITELKEQLHDQRTQQEKEMAQMKAQMEAQKAMVDYLLARFQNENA